MTLTALAPADVTATELYDAALQAQRSGAGAELRATCPAWSCALPLRQWCAPVDDLEVAVLDRLRAELPAVAAVLDLGCGPGRHSAYLTGQGLQVLGVDTSRTAVALTRAAGARALVADALGPLPAARWQGVLLLDGNIGIGGDPLLLLCRVRGLLAHDGRLLLELDADDVTGRSLVQLCSGARTSAPFAWARLAAEDLSRAAALAGLAVLDRWDTGGRRFALLGPVQS